tara:strand:- start:402 stop:728 length:327 start_codon:yes stop_codon:yes gene_type:complete
MNRSWGQNLPVAPGDNMNIKVVRIISGEELIGDWNDEKSTITNPVIMVPVAKDKLGFSPWIPYVEEEEFPLKEQHIVTILTPDNKLQNEYNRVYGSGLIVPDADRIIN